MNNPWFRLLDPRTILADLRINCNSSLAQTSQGHVMNSTQSNLGTAALPPAQICRKIVIGRLDLPARREGLPGRSQHRRRRKTSTIPMVRGERRGAGKRNAVRHDHEKRSRLMPPQCLAECRVVNVPSPSASFLSCVYRTACHRSETYLPRLHQKRPLSGADLSSDLLEGTRIIQVRASHSCT